MASVRVGGLLKKEEVEGKGGGGMLRGKGEKVLWRMAIEDPFECYGSNMVHDLGGVLKEAIQKKMLEGFREAYTVMSREGGGEGGRGVGRSCLGRGGERRKWLVREEGEGEEKEEEEVRGRRGGRKEGSREGRKEGREEEGEGGREEL